MIEVSKKLSKKIEDAVEKLYPGILKEEICLEIPKQEKFGDYSCSVAMKLAKLARKSPMEVAQKLSGAIEALEEFEAPSVVAPGFLNFSFTKKFLFETLSKIVQSPDVLKPNIGNGKTVVTDISHPNVAKPMGAHHLLSTLIGDSINRLLAYCGYRVIRDNYLGDFGTQFGKLIFAYKKWGDEKIVAKDPIPELLKLYVKFHDEAEKNPTLEEEGRKEFKKLEEGDRENKKLWQRVVDLSLQEFRKTWDLLEVRFDVIHGESFYEDKMEEILGLGWKKKVFTEGERGAWICEFPDEGYPPALVRKSDGATLYATRDLARIKFWEKEWHPELMLNVVDMAQKMYFQQLFAMVEKLGLTEAKNIHIAFGRMSFPDRRMSTRKGNIVLLEEVIDEIITLARKIVEEKNADLSESEKTEVAKMVGIGALKFAVLVQNRETNTTFTWEKMLSLEGESAPYVQYAYARIQSILRKSGFAPSSSLSTSASPSPIVPHNSISAPSASSLPAVHELFMNSSLKFHEHFMNSSEGGGSEMGGGSDGKRENAEKTLCRMIVQFPFILERTLEDFRPNLLAKYCSDLASAFNAFYGACPVLKAENGLKENRLMLIAAVATVLKTGLDLLGIQTPEEM